MKMPNTPKLWRFFLLFVALTAISVTLILVLGEGVDRMIGFGTMFICTLGVLMLNGVLYFVLPPLSGAKSRRKEQARQYWPVNGFLALMLWGTLAAGYNFALFGSAEIAAHIEDPLLLAINVPIWIHLTTPVAMFCVLAISRRWGMRYVPRTTK